MSRLSAITLILAALLLTNCVQTPPAAPPDTRAADQKAIADGEANWNADWKAKDLDKIVSHYANDARVLLPEMPEMKGKDAIRAGMKTFLDDPNTTLIFTPSIIEVAKSGDLAYLQGTYTMTMTSPKTKKVVTEKGKYVTVYRKEADGSWKALVDIDNTDEPAK